MLRKIDCVMVPVGDLEEGAAFYTRVFGLTRLWQDDTSVGMGLPETDAEIVLHTMQLPPEPNVYYLVDDVDAAAAGGCRIRIPPFDVVVGRCAVVEDPFGNAIGLIDLSKGPR